MANYKLRLDGHVFDCFGMTEVEGITYIGCTEDIVVAIQGVDANQLFKEQNKRDYKDIKLENVVADKYTHNEMGLRLYRFMNNFTFDCIKPKEERMIPKVQVFIKGTEDFGQYLVHTVTMRFYGKRVTFKLAVLKKYAVEEMNLNHVWEYIANGLSATRMVKDYSHNKLVGTGVSKQTASKYYDINSKLEGAMKELFGALYGMVDREIHHTKG